LIDSYGTQLFPQLELITNDLKSVTVFHFHLFRDNVIVTSANVLLPRKELLFLPAFWCQCHSTAGTDVPRKLDSSYVWYQLSKLLLRLSKMEKRSWPASSVLIDLGLFPDANSSFIFEAVLIMTDPFSGKIRSMTTSSDDFSCRL